MVSEIPAQWNNAGVASQLLIVKMPHWDGYRVTFLAHTKGMVSDMCRQTTNLRAGAATCIEFKLSWSHPTIVWFEQNFWVLFFQLPHGNITMQTLCSNFFKCSHLRSSNDVQMMFSCYKEFEFVYNSRVGLRTTLEIKPDRTSTRKLG